MRLFINNLPLNITEEDLTDLFSPYASVISTKIITDADSGESRGFAFVEVSSFDDGENAIKNLNGKTVEENVIIVEKARAKK